MVKPRDTKLLVNLREGKGLSQRQAAKAVAISHGHMADIERGSRQPSYEVGKRIADFYGVSVRSLFDEIPLEFDAPPESEPVSA